MRGKKRAEERAARAAEKAAKEESKRQEELRSYKGLMRVGGAAAVGCGASWRAAHVLCVFCCVLQAFA